ncbi:MAG: hypothetical protein CSA76_04010 [Spirochaetales bacterium]|nr:MAG: hypothetical protein CSA76_04010 [Spirochaetales bacterium]
MTAEIWLNAFLALFAILNPIGLVPIYAEYIGELDWKTRFNMFNISVLTGLITMTIMTLTGQWLMSRVFQIDIQMFRITGGLLLTVLAVRYIVFPPRQGPRYTREDDITSQALEFAVVPMAVPLMVGPGSIVTGILLLDQYGYAVTLSSLAAIFLLCWIIFQLTPWFSLLMGKVGRMVISRVLWIFIGAIGVKYLVTGIQNYFGL